MERKRKAVSLFTREWIEISADSASNKALRSPSLRGSGLKLISVSIRQKSGCRLPLYEGVD